MLTLDDLEHFGEKRYAPLFSPPTAQANSDTAARLARILACHNFCRDIPDAHLIPDGAAAARITLRQAHRSWRRGQTDAGEFARALDTVGALLGLGLRHAGESDDALALRSAIESAIQQQAADLAGQSSVDVELFASLASGEFELMPTSELGALPDSSFNRAVELDLDFVVQTDCGAEFVRVHLQMECGLWRWSANEGSCMSRNGAAAVFLEPDDAIVMTLVAALALRNGRAAREWAATLSETRELQLRSA